MNISEVINKLQEVRESHGDIQLLVSQPNSVVFDSVDSIRVSEVTGAWRNDVRYYKAAVIDLKKEI